MKKRIALLLSVILVVLAMPGVSLDASERIISDAIKVLQDFGADDLMILSNTESSQNGDNLVKNPYITVVFNDTSYAFLNEKGVIIRIKRVDEIRKQKQKGYKSSSKFRSLEDLKAYAEKHLIGNEYELTNEYYFSENSLSLRYEKKLLPGASDRYDYISIRIDTDLIELETYYRANSGFQLEKDKCIISKEKAIAVANDVLNESEKIINTQLATVKTNKFYNNIVIEDNLRLAYIISTESNVVYVDAYTAEIIGGDEYKEIRGGAIGASELSTASESINLAKTSLENMGYTITSKILTSQFATCVPSLLKSAFYSCSHGNATMISSRKNIDDDNRVFYASDVPSGTYKFVFLDACNTASPEWKSAFGISNYSTNKAFLGWTNTVTTTASYNFCSDFWSYISSTYTVYEAAQDAADNDASKPIQFTGDATYNGYY